MSGYPKIFKVEAIVCHHNRMHVALYEFPNARYASIPEFRENGPRYLFEVDIEHPNCPGFTTLVKQGRDYWFDAWGDEQWATRITDGEAAVEHHHMLDWGGHVVASWEGNQKKISVIDQNYSDWIAK